MTQRAGSSGPITRTDAVVNIPASAGIATTVDLVASVVDAEVGDMAEASTAVVMPAGLFLSHAWVSAAGQVTVRFGVTSAAAPQDWPGGNVQIALRK